MKKENLDKLVTTTLLSLTIALEIALIVLILFHF